MSGERSQRGEQGSGRPVVLVVDDDPAVPRALEPALRDRGCEVRAFGSAQEFLAEYDAAAGCIILDLALAGIDGLEVQARLAAEGCHSPIIFLTAHADIPASVRAVRAGALDVLNKPVENAELLRAIDEALSLHAERRQLRSLLSADEHRLRTLTSRERQVLEQVVAGRLNKQIAAELGVVEDTVKMHRGRAMRKLGVRSLAELVRFMLRVERVSDPALPVFIAGDELLGSAALREQPSAHAEK